MPSGVRAILSVLVLVIPLLFSGCASSPSEAALTYTLPAGGGTYSVPYTFGEVPTLGKWCTLTAEVFASQSLFGGLTLSMNKQVFDREQIIDRDASRGTSRYTFSVFAKGFDAGGRDLEVTVDGAVFNVQLFSGREASSSTGGAQWTTTSYVIPAPLAAAMKTMSAMSFNFSGPATLNAKQVALVKSFLSETERVTFADMKPLDKGADPSRSSAVTTYIGADDPGVELEDVVLHVKAVSLSTMTGMPGSYSLTMTYNVENTGSRDMQFDPANLVVVNLETGAAFKPMGSFYKPFAVEAGKTVSGAYLAFDMVTGAPPRQVKVTFGPASATIDGKAGVVRF